MIPTLRKNLKEGVIYADTPTIDRWTTFLRFRGLNDESILFEYIDGSQAYIHNNGYITFSKDNDEDDYFYELTPSELSDLELDKLED